MMARPSKRFVTLACVLGAMLLPGVSRSQDSALSRLAVAVEAKDQSALAALKDDAALRRALADLGPDAAFETLVELAGALRDPDLATQAYPICSSLAFRQATALTRHEGTPGGAIAWAQSS